jgi:hypothetical protein
LLAKVSAQVKKNEVTTLKEYLLADSLKHEELFSSIITKNRKMRAIFQYIEAIAGTKEPVLVTGETGWEKNSSQRRYTGSPPAGGRLSLPMYPDWMTTCSPIPFSVTKGEHTPGRNKHGTGSSSSHPRGPSFSMKSAI